MLRISRGVKIQLLVFLLISVAGVVYTGARFVGLPLVTSSYTVVADFPSSGGIFTNAEVDYRGVPVGRVGALHLIPGGVAVDLSIDSGRPIPADTTAAVENLTAVGEQYVELEPKVDHGPYLHPGSVIGLGSTSVPVGYETILVNLDNLVSSVNLKDLSITVAELGKAFTGLGPALHALIANGDALTQAAQQNLPSNIALINDGRTVLDTQLALNGDLQTFATNLDQFSAQLVASDHDLRSFLSNGVGGTAQLQQVLASNARALPVLLGNLLTVGQIQAARLPGLREVLLLYPGSVADGFLVDPGDGTAHFGFINDNNPPVCTNGYQAVVHRDGSGKGNLSRNDGGPANLNVDCTDKSSPSQLDDLRGARNQPRPAGDTTATVHSYSTESFPYGPPTSAPGYASAYGSGSGSGSGSGTAPGSGSGSGSPLPGGSGGTPVAVGPYDPLTGLFALPGGGTARLGDLTAAFEQMGADAWQYPLLSALAP